MSLLAVSIYPDREEKREELIVTTGVQLLVKLEEERRKRENDIEKKPEEQRISIPLEWLKVIVRSPAADQVIKDAGANAVYSWVAGELIMFMISAAIRHPQLDVTMTKAVWALPRLLRGEETYGGGSVSLSQRTVWKAWSRFKPVPHLHAIRQIWLQDKNRRTGPDIASFVGMHNEKILEYLSMAEAIRKAAVERKILRHEETWWPPETLKLPPARVGVPALPPSALEELARYAPEHSKDAGMD
jgi:hypothetical protein